MFKLEHFDQIASKHSGIIADHSDEEETEMAYFKFKYELSGEEKIENRDVYHKFMNPHLHKDSPVIEGVTLEYDEHFSPNPNRLDNSIAELRGDDIVDIVETAHKYLEQMGVEGIEDYSVRTDEVHETLDQEDLE